MGVRTQGSGAESQPPEANEGLGADPSTLCGDVSSFSKNKAVLSIF